MDSTIYWNQILKRPLMEFWEKSFGDIQEPILIKDNSAIHKKI